MPVRLRSIPASPLASRSAITRDAPCGRRCVRPCGRERHGLDGLYIRTYAYHVDVEWDPGKARANARKHGVDFADAATVLHDERAVTVRDDDADEERFVTVGQDALGRILVVVFTWRGDRVRLISGRRATRRERRVYEEGR